MCHLITQTMCHLNNYVHKHGEQLQLPESIQSVKKTGNYNGESEQCKTNLSVTVLFCQKLQLWVSIY